ncbi:dihydropteroate synthase [Blastococcus mobilis]|uniref:Dihydropteroate synthase n=1 Tax=Blastococcus mobilis TaxID=1938746 RepID=A0A239A5Q1_9ACTN|nr:dihydropteroate synthase [Blastococcus mobilis]SNR90965.1 Dihydropteroate synthase [Blastococcus mobilis]
MRADLAGVERVAPARKVERWFPPPLDRCRVMGILNVTPDSFSDGGRYPDMYAAVAHGLAMHGAGADLVDVGGESTRPGAGRISAGEERRRVLPVITELSRAGVPVSVDTTRAEVAAAAIEAGAVMVNDVSGGCADPGMVDVVAGTGVRWVLMHWRGHSRDMYARAHYRDVVTEVSAELTTRAEAAVAAGVNPAQLILDPGLGFAKEAGHDWTLLAGLDRLVALGCPVLVGASRKSFLGRLLADRRGQVRPVQQRDAGTLAITVLAAQAGVWGVRVHDVGSSVDAVLTVAAARAQPRSPGPVLG